MQTTSAAQGAGSTELERFIEGMNGLLARELDEPVLLQQVANLLKGLVSRDDWLPEAFARPHPRFYQQYLLHADPLARFSVVSFVWGPGQETPVHDHGVWGAIGMLRGEELSQCWRQVPQGLVMDGPPRRLRTGQTMVLSVAAGDIHQVSNAFEDRVSISIHVYGADIGRQRRHVFDPGTGVAKEFVSGYADVAGWRA